MPTLKGGYFLKDGTRVPSVTTVISKYKESGGLIHWAWNLGKQGKDYREERDKAADAGTLAHAAVDAWIHKQPFKFDGEDDTIKNAQTAYGAFLEWANITRLQITHTEMPLISEKYRFGGTFDAVTIGNARAIADWKSSNSVYPEYLIQIAAYGKLWEEHFPNDPILGGFHLVRFDKKHGDFSHRWWGELDKAWDAFLHLRALYDIDVELKRRVK